MVDPKNEILTESEAAGDTAKEPERTPVKDQGSILAKSTKECLEALKQQNLAITVPQYTKAQDGTTPLVNKESNVLESDNGEAQDVLIVDTNLSKSGQNVQSDSREVGTGTEDTNSNLNNRLKTAEASEMDLRSFEGAMGQIQDQLALASNYSAAMRHIQVSKANNAWIYMLLRDRKDVPACLIWH